MEGTIDFNWNVFINEELSLYFQRKLIIEQCNIEHDISLWDGCIAAIFVRGGGRFSLPQKYLGNATQTPAPPDHTID